jgi:hypothetical protein
VQCSSAYGKLIAESRGADVHACDGANNSYSALRWVRPYGAHGELLYAQFADVSNAAAWRFAYDELNFFELYNMTADRASPPRASRAPAARQSRSPSHCDVRCTPSLCSGAPSLSPSRSLSLAVYPPQRLRS